MGLLIITVRRAQNLELKTCGEGEKCRGMALLIVAIRRALIEHPREDVGEFCVTNSRLDIDAFVFTLVVAFKWIDGM